MGSGAGKKPLTFPHQKIRKKYFPIWLNNKILKILSRDESTEYFLKNSFFRKFRSTYGDIFGFSFGPRKAVVLNNYDLVQEAFSKADFAGRPLLKAWEYMRQGTSINDEQPGKEIGAVLSAVKNAVLRISAVKRTMRK